MDSLNGKENLHFFIIIAVLSRIWSFGLQIVMCRFIADFYRNPSISTHLLISAQSFSTGPLIRIFYIKLANR